MDPYSQKVVWSEGMLLSPHHFQQATRYMETLLRRRVRGIRALDWGFCTLQVDALALTAGSFGVQACSGVLPNGQWFDTPELDRVPPSRPVDPHFPTGATSLSVYLGMPQQAAGEMSCLPPGSSATNVATPYAGESAAIRDEMDSTREREILVAAKRLQLLFEGESLAGSSCLKVAQLRRTSSGGIEIDPEFVPPCQHASASPRLMGILEHTINVLANRSDELSDERPVGGWPLKADVPSNARVWILHTVNSHLPVLRSLHAQGQVHPEEVHRELATLAGKLCTFTPDGNPRDVPVYDHSNPGKTFNTIQRMLSRLLAVKVPEAIVEVVVVEEVVVEEEPPYTLIPLKKIRESVFAAQIEDEGILATRLYLGVSADVPDEKVTGELPTKAKITSAERIDTLIARAMRGLGLKYLLQPPSDLPVQPGQVYFELVPEGPQWEAILTGKTIAFYVPREFTGISLALLALKA